MFLVWFVFLGVYVDKLFAIKEEKKGEKAVAHLKKVFDTFHAIRNSLSSMRAGVSLTSTVCTPESLAPVLAAFDAFDGQMIHAMDQLANTLGEHSIGVIEVSTATVASDKAAAVSDSIIGKAPASSKASSSTESPKSTSEKPVLQKLLTTLQKNSEQTPGGSLPGADKEAGGV
jgi:hypothetical protein